MRVGNEYDGGEVNEAFSDSAQTTRVHMRLVNMTYLSQKVSLLLVEAFLGRVFILLLSSCVSIIHPFFDMCNACASLVRILRSRNHAKPISVEIDE